MSSTSTVTSDAVADINTLSAFLTKAEIEIQHLLESDFHTDAVVICVSAILHPAETLFHVLEKRPDLAKTLILCGGIGHSTPLIWEAVARHKAFHGLGDEVRGLREARVLEKILYRYFDVATMTSRGCRILIEDKSTNSSENATESRTVLEDAGITSPSSVLLMQDPTMQIRTVASFEKAYKDLESPPKILSCPLMVPRMRLGESGPEFDIPEVSSAGLWDPPRFFGLIMGEVPRLDKYGPKGTKSIVQVDVPIEVTAAQSRLQGILVSKR